MKRNPERPGATTVHVGAADASSSPRVQEEREVREGVREEPIGRRFRREDRLLDSRDFTRVLRRGRRRSSPELVVVTSRAQATTPGRRVEATEAGARLPSRLGITVGRKAGPSVKRNRFKRRVREWFRHHRDGLPEPVDLIVIARRPGIDLGLAELGAHLSRLLAVQTGQDPGKIQDF